VPAETSGAYSKLFQRTLRDNTDEDTKRQIETLGLKQIAVKDIGPGTVLLTPGKKETWALVKGLADQLPTPDSKVFFLEDVFEAPSPGDRPESETTVVESLAFVYIEAVLEKAGTEGQRHVLASVLDMVYAPIQNGSNTASTPAETTRRAGLLSEFEMIVVDEQVGIQAGQTQDLLSRSDNMRKKVEGLLQKNQQLASIAAKTLGGTDISLSAAAALGGNGDKSSSNRVYLDVKQNGPSVAPILNHQMLTSKTFQTAIEDSHMYRLFTATSEEPISPTCPLMHGHSLVSIQNLIMELKVIVTRWDANVSTDGAVSSPQTRALLLRESSACKVVKDPALLERVLKGQWGHGPRPLGGIWITTFAGTEDSILECGTPNGPPKGVTGETENRIRIARAFDYLEAVFRILFGEALWRDSFAVIGQAFTKGPFSRGRFNSYYALYWYERTLYDAMNVLYNGTYDAVYGYDLRVAEDVKRYLMHVLSPQEILKSMSEVGQLQHDREGDGSKEWKWSATVRARGTMTEEDQDAPSPTKKAKTETNLKPSDGSAKQKQKRDGQPVSFPRLDGIGQDGSSGTTGTATWGPFGGMPPFAQMYGMPWPMFPSPLATQQGAAGLAPSATALTTTTPKKGLCEFGFLNALGIKKPGTEELYSCSRKVDGACRFSHVGIDMGDVPMPSKTELRAFLDSRKSPNSLLNKVEGLKADVIAKIEALPN